MAFSVFILPRFTIKEVYMILMEWSFVWFIKRITNLLYLYATRVCGFKGFNSNEHTTFYDFETYDVFVFIVLLCCAEFFENVRKTLQKFARRYFNINFTSKLTLLSVFSLRGT